MYSIQNKNTVKPPSGENEDDGSGNIPGRSNKDFSSGSGFVSNETPEYRQEQTGIKVSYVLTKKEIYECLRTAGTFRTNSKSFIFVNALFTALTITFLIYAKIKNRGAFFFLAAIFVSLLVIFGFFPIRINHIRAETSADGHKICMRIYPKHIEIGRGANKLYIPLDGSAESAKVGDMIVIVVHNENDPKGKKEYKMFILPLRCLDPVLVPDVQAAVFSGTKPRKIRL